MRVWQATAAIACALLGCSFDQTGPGGNDARFAPVDAPRGDAAAERDADEPSTDASPCPAPLHLRLTVDGVDEPSLPYEPYAHVLLGDTIELSAAGSCVHSGTISYEWQISPINDTRESALPDLRSETITVYATEADQYTVSLTVHDGQGRSETRTVFGFEVHAWQRLDGLPEAEARDLAVDAQDLWIAGKAGAFHTSLLAPGLLFMNLNNESVGSAVESDLAAVFVDADAGYAWFGRALARFGLWRVDLDVAPRQVDDIGFAAIDALGAPAEVEAVGRAEPGVVVATNLGVTWATDNATFTGRFQPGFRVHALARGSGQVWSGGFDLYDMDDGGTSLDPFDLGTLTDDQIRALAVDEAAGELWIGGDRKAIARLDNATGAVIAIYDNASSDLQNAKIRDLVVERTGRFAGDVWAATEHGMARFKRDRQVWVPMDAADGLTQRDNLLTVVVDESGGRRVVYAGSTSGLVYIRAP